MPIHQSAYRQWRHSAKTTLLKIYNDLLRATDRGKSTALFPIDLSAVFDTVDHELLLKRLEYKLGIVVQDLEWFKS